MGAADDSGDACVCELTEPLGLTQPTISHHLKIVLDAGIFTRDKHGGWVYYALVTSATEALSPLLSTGSAGRDVRNVPVGTARARICGQLRGTAVTRG